MGKFLLAVISKRWLHNLVKALEKEQPFQVTHNGLVHVLPDAEDPDMSIVVASTQPHHEFKRLHEAFLRVMPRGAKKNLFIGKGFTTHLTLCKGHLTPEQVDAAYAAARAAKFLPWEARIIVLYARVEGSGPYRPLVCCLLGGENSVLAPEQRKQYEELKVLCQENPVWQLAM